MRKNNSEIEAVFQEVITSLKPVTGMNDQAIEECVAEGMLGKPVESVNNMTLDDLRAALLNYLEVVNHEMNQKIFDEMDEKNLTPN